MKESEVSHHMFMEAMKKAREFTKPVIASTRTLDGKVACGVGSFIVVNEGGWILTAAHLFHSLKARDDHAEGLSRYRTKVSAIQADISLRPEKRAKLLKGLSRENWVTDVSHWWSVNDCQMTDIHCDFGRDLAVGKLSSPEALGTVPAVFADPSSEFLPGRQLCRLGFAFHNPTSTYDSETGGFALGPESLPVPFFCNDGMVTRMVQVVLDQGREVQFFELTTPGIKGQSGGPLADSRGLVWGIQSRTATLDLDFVGERKGESAVRQYLNVGWAVHLQEIVQFLRERNVAFNCLARDSVP